MQAQDALAAGHLAEARFSRGQHDQLDLAQVELGDFQRSGCRRSGRVGAVCSPPRTPIRKVIPGGSRRPHGRLSGQAKSASLAIATGDRGADLGRREEAVCGDVYETMLAQFLADLGVRGLFLAQLGDLALAVFSLERIADGHDLAASVVQRGPCMETPGPRWRRRTLRRVACLRGRIEIHVAHQQERSGRALFRGGVTTQQFRQHPGAGTTDNAISSNR